MHHFKTLRRRVVLKNLVLAMSCLPLLASCGAQSMQPSVVWDLSQGNTIDRLGWPGGELKGNDGTMTPAGLHHWLAVPNGLRSVTIILPGNRSFCAIVDGVVVETYDDRIFYIKLYYPNMTTEDSMELARKLLLEFDHVEGVDRLNKWYEKVAGFQGGLDFEYYPPDVNVRIRFGFLKKTPWTVEFALYFESSERLKEAKDDAKDDAKDPK